jgi:hypothetical protein
MRATSASRSLLVAMSSGAFSLASIHAIAWWFGVEPAPAVAMAHASMVSSAATVTAHHDRGLWPLALGTAFIPPAVVFLPEHVYLVTGIGSFIILGLLGLRWWRS